ncbi:hypothetical protein OG218_00495 [Kineococcus sp. NBC_00420]|uniref:hypothetical protein n=1 Tax=Kineococcus sp. NBC_00420 TaxID=2903564 RepID=UPI002E23DBB1
MRPFPVDCYVTTSISYLPDAAALPDLKAIRAELAQLSAKSSASLPAASPHEAGQGRAWATAAHALSRPDARSSTEATSLRLTAYDGYGRMTAEANYGRRSQASLNSNLADGYLLSTVTYLADPLSDLGICATTSS